MWGFRMFGQWSCAHTPWPPWPPLMSSPERPAVRFLQDVFTCLVSHVSIFTHEPYYILYLERYAWVNSQWPKSICYQLLHSVSIVFRGMVFHICISWRTQEISRVPRILSSKCENPKQRYWYHLCIEWNCVEKDGTVNISWLVKYFFDNLFVNNCVIVLKRRHNIGVIAPNWPSLKNEIILERWWWRHDD